MDYQNPYQQNPYNSYNQQAQAQQNDSFGWDDEIKEETSFVLLPEGDYMFTIKKFEKARFEGSEKLSACNKAVVTFTVQTPDGRTTEITENYLLHKKMEWKLSEFFAAVGMKKKDEPVKMCWTPELIGKQGVCKIVVHKYKKDNEDRQTNRIDKLYPSYAQPAIAPPVQMQYQASQPPQQYSVPNQYQQTAPPVQGGWTPGNF